jgi:GAF domain-containing protein
MGIDPLDPAGASAELRDLMRFYEDPASVLSGVVGLAQRRIPAADDVSVTLVREGRPATVASTGRLASDLDESQYRRGHGPCLDAGYADETMLIDDFAYETRWPDYGEDARRQGLGSSMSVPLPVESYLVGALNLYALTAGVFDADSVEIGRALSAQLTLWLSHAERTGAARARASDIQEALQARAVVDQAKGSLMAQLSCTAQEAFAALREAAHQRGVALADYAATIVAAATPALGERPSDDPGTPS